MKIMTALKKFSIQMGLYGPARWIARHLRSAQLQAHYNDMSFYRSLLHDSAFCFDVGANIGEKSEAMLKIGARVVSFEPSPEALFELRARCGRYKAWTLVPAAVGSEASIAILNCSQDSSKSSFVEGWNKDVVSTAYVPVVTLDTAIKTFGMPSYCKVDVEGWELEVLRGLTHPIALLSFEFHLSERGIANTLLCLKRLEDFGPSYVNITSAESPFFHFPEWIPLKQYVKWFPGDLKHTLPGYLYGDIFVKNVSRN